MNRKPSLATLGATLALAALAVPALAQERGPTSHGARGPGQMFQAADANNDGRVTQDEAWTALSARFGEADADKDGGVTWEEARAYAQAHMRGRLQHTADRMDQRGQGVFRALDADRDGKVTLTELRPAAEAMFRSRDTNADGALTRDEVGPQRRR